MSKPAHKKTVEELKAQQELGANDPHALLAAEPLENLAFARYRMQDYIDCVGNAGCYWADLDTQYKRAQEALTVQENTKKRGEKLALVMDIDETSLSAYCEIFREDFGFMMTADDLYTVSEEAAVAIPGAVRLFNQAKAAGVAVFFITGRPALPDPDNPHPRNNQLAGTAQNLEAAGFHGWTGLQLRNGAENKLSTIEYKSAERRKIVDKGYRIVMSVGDQWSDLMGDPKAEVSVKLPNPFYYLP